MAGENDPTSETLPVDALERIERDCRDFEAAWKRGETPSMEEAIAETTGPERAQLFIELLLLEIDYRRRRGESPNAADYKARFPGDAESIDAAFGRPVELVNPSSSEEAREPAVQRRSLDSRSLLGSSIGPYKLLDVLGDGGMGVVYLAEQKTPIRRRVALKLIKRGMDTAEVIARFEAERQALALMNHPNIAKVHEAGTTEDGRPYFVMEHVPGEPITSYCDRQRLSTKDRLGLFMEVCQAVQHAHQKAVIHRDLKPSNVLVMVEGGKPIPKVIDFGVAKATNQRLTEKTVYTELGQIIGTPEYMSPEQAEMTAVDIDTRTDIYSLGVMLYELIVGVLPFDRKALREAGYAGIQRIIREKEPQKPSTRLSGLGKDSTLAAEKRRTDPGRLLRELRGDLDWIAMKALEKDRMRRYSTASELAADITRHLSHEPVLAGPPDMGYRARKFLRKHRGPVGAAAGILVVLVAGLVTSLVLYARADRATQEKGQALAEKTKAVDDKNQALEKLKKEAIAKEETLQRSEALRLTAQSSAVLPANPGLALLLAIEGTKRYPGLLVNNALLDALQATRERRVLRDLSDVLCAEFSPDGNWVVTASANNTSSYNAARIWNVETGREIPLRGHTTNVNHAAFSPDGTRVVTASDDHTARIWDAGTGKEMVVLNGHGEGFGEAFFSPDGRRLVTTPSGFDYKTARIWDAGTGREIVALKGHEEGNIHASFSPDGKRVVTASRDKTARIWDAGTGKEIALLKGHEEDVLQASFSPDGRRVATASDDKMARIWDSGTGKEIALLKGHEGSINCAVFSPNGKRVVTASSDKTARIWDAEIGEEVGKEIVPLRGHEDFALQVAFSPDGKRVVTTFDLTTGQLWDAETAEEIASLGGQEGWDWVVKGIFDPDRKRMVMPTDHNAALISDAETGRETLLRGHTANVSQAALSPDQKRVVTASDDKTARIWDAVTGKEIVSLRGHEGEVGHAAFSPDGKRIVTASADRTARIWDAVTGREVASLRGHSDSVDHAAYSPDGKRVVTASRDKTTRIWDAETGHELLTLKGHHGGVWRVAFSPDGMRVVAASSDTARVWRLDLLVLAESRNLRDFTPDERDRFEIGSPEEREEKRRPWEIAELLEKLEIASTALSHDALWTIYDWEFLADAKRLMELSRERSDEGSIRSLEKVHQYARSAVLRLEADDAQAVERSDLSHALDQYRGLLLPDLISLASIDAALLKEAAESLIAEGSSWRFYRGRRDASADLKWTEVQFDDASWEEGPSGFGYGDDDPATLLADMKGQYTSVYCRAAFEVSETARFQELRLSVRADDGFVAYLNGREVGRINAGRSGERLAFDATAAFNAQKPLVPAVIELPLALIRTGKNVLAIQGLNASKDSSSFSLIPVVHDRRRLDFESVRKRFEAFIGEAKGPDAKARIAYLDGRLLEEAGRPRAAMAKFEEVLADGSSGQEPFQRLAECARALGEPPTSLEARLRRALLADEKKSSALWDLWFRLSAVDLKLGSQEILGNLPGGQGDERREDLRWVLNQICSGEDVRINCGGEEYTPPAGRTWGRDRFFVGGARRGQDQSVEIHSTLDAPLYRTVRSSQPFQWKWAYRVPLPVGVFRVVLHFVETELSSKRRQVFDVLLEGERALEAYAPGDVGLATASLKAFEVAVKDGHLDVQLVSRQGIPVLAAMELRRLEGKIEEPFTVRAVPMTLPATPCNLRPRQDALAQEFPLVLEADPYAHPEPEITHCATRWQIRAESGSYERSPVLDLLSETDLRSLTLPAARLVSRTKYFWRVAYLGTGPTTSAFSAETSFTTSDTGLEPVPFDLSPYSNRDVVLNPGDDTNDFFDRSESYLLEEGFGGPSADAAASVQGLPRDRIVGVHKLASYDGPNALQLGPEDKLPVILKIPVGRYAGVRFLVSGGNGDSEMPVVFGYADGTTQENVVPCDDWFDDHPPDPTGTLHRECTPVWNNMDRVYQGHFEDTNDPALFEIFVALDPQKNLEAITLQADRAAYDRRAGPSTTRFNLFAITGMAKK